MWGDQFPFLFFSLSLLGVFPAALFPLVELVAISVSLLYSTFDLLVSVLCFRCACFFRVVMKSRKNE